jgi:Asp/Glu/hydantoin racemase
MEKNILIINPNTDLIHTERMEKSCGEIANPGTKVKAVSPQVTETFDVPVVGCWVDEYLTAVETFKIIEKEQKNYDGVIIACFSDPGLDPSREISEIPVLGIGETSYLVACLLGHKFSVLTYTKKMDPP